ncbi:Oidioi.mRNA.OKI2018_I69.chr2.g5226.t1.cds [Oikopleura dioica]|uniref:Oidioi.mRNA.OKI2018_I69.chr2.g5226.t1.cds n=1 Tax=Oikopleura dioica TaxID=34765 RepID=A0ABN7T080_OIKDI|nr:Oidioi.mRNA.OKI2018_I69.chr2.g5226.t1.cds [Oikopleura dioica]
MKLHDLLQDEEVLILGDRKMSSKKNIPLKASIMIPAEIPSCERPILAKRLLAKGALGEDSKEIILPSKKTITSTTTSASFSEDSTSSSTSFVPQ